MKKLIASIVLSGTLVAGVCATAGCNGGNDASLPNGGNTQITLSDGIGNSGEFYAYGAASVGSIISASTVQATGAVSEMPVVVGEIIGASTDEETPEEDEETPEEDEETPDENEETPDEDEETPDGGNGAQHPEWGMDYEFGWGDFEHGFNHGGWGDFEHGFNHGGWDDFEHGFNHGGWDDFEHGFNHGNSGEEEIPSASLSDEDIETLNGYMSLVENLLANGNLGCVRYESDRADYAVKEVVTYGDLQGNTVSYTTYYNLTLDYVEEDGDEVEENYSIVGIMVIDGVEYALEGHTETETEGDEAESESYYKVTLSDGNYIIMENEDESGEKSLTYKLVQDRKVVEKISFEYENDENETELEMTIEKDGAFTELEFSEEVLEDARAIEVVITENGDRSKFNVFITKDEEGNDVYRYTFGNSFKDMHKNHRSEAHGRR